MRIKHIPTLLIGLVIFFAALLLAAAVKTAYVTGRSVGHKQITEQEHGRKLQDSIDSVAVSAYPNHSEIKGR